MAAKEQGPKTARKRKKERKPVGEIKMPGLEKQD